LTQAEKLVEHHSLKARQLMANATAIYSAGVEGSTRGLVLTQTSRYDEALEVLEQTRAWITKSLTWCDFTSRVYPLALEAALGQRKRAVRLLTAAIKASEYHEAYFERARALLDRALLNPQTASQDRQQALELLERLQCVLPEAESQTHFGLDRSQWPHWFNTYS